jgi:hypothetical protein
MHSPVQSLPVQRGVVSYSPADDTRDAAGSELFAGGNGVVASSEMGAAPSDLFGDIFKVAAPVLGGLLGGI